MINAGEMNSSPGFVAESGGPEDVIVLAAGEIASSGVGILGGAVTSGSASGWSMSIVFTS